MEVVEVGQGVAVLLGEGELDGLGLDALHARAVVGRGQRVADGQARLVVRRETVDDLLATDVG